jgi:hypothetical protein
MVQVHAFEGWLHGITVSTLCDTQMGQVPPALGANMVQAHVFLVWFQGTTVSSLCDTQIGQVPPVLSAKNGPGSCF